MPPVRFLLSLLAAASFSCAAAPFAAQVGDVRIALDAPPGFADTAFTGSPRLQELGESLTSASNRILLFAISDADLRRFMGGDPMEARRYMVVVTPRVLERDRVTPAVFATLVEDTLRPLGSAAPAGTDLRKYLDAREGQQPVLAELRREPDAVSVLQGIRFPSPPRQVFADEKPAQYALSTTSLVVLRGKAVSLTVHALYETPADLEWIRSATLRWIDDLKRLNTR
jgi:hypothetical protein